MRSDTVFDTHEIARSLTAADLTDAQADAITAAVRRAAEHDAAGVDVDALATKADLAHFATKEELRAELASLEARLAWRLIGAGIAIAGIQAAALFALLRLTAGG